MPIQALDLSKVHDFISKLDDPKDPTIFKLRTLSSRDVGRIRDSVTNISFHTDGTDDENSAEGKEINTKVERSTMNFEAVRRSLNGWENFMGPKNKPLKYEDMAREIDGKQRRIVKPDLLDLVPLDVVMEMGEFILDGSEVGEAAMGNSAGPPTVD